MRIPDPKANTTTEAYLAYKAGYLEQSELKPVLYEPYLHFDGWLAYWAGLTTDYPHGTGKNLAPSLDGYAYSRNGAGTTYSVSENSLTINTSTRGAGVYMSRGSATNVARCPYLFQNGYVVSMTVSATANGILRIGPDVAGARIEIDVGPEPVRVSFETRTNNIVFYQMNEGSLECTMSDIQCERGSTATDYEPYTIIPEMLTDEEALVAYLSGVTNTYPEEIKDPYDVRIVGYLKHLASIRWPEPDYPVNNEEFYLSTMEPTHTSNPVPSSDIELDTAEGKIISVEAYGDTYQQTYSGKNLMPMEVSDNTLSRANYFKISLPAGTYTISFDLSDIELGSNQSFNMSMTIMGATSGGNYDGNISGTISSTEATHKSFTFTTTADSDVSANSNIRIGQTYWDNGARAKLSNIQIEAGSNATSFEPYVGGVPAPNPDYPQNVNVVTGRQVVGVRGKNLWGGFPNSFTRTNAGVTFTYNTDGTAVVDGTSNQAAALSITNALAESNNIYVTIDAGTYTISSSNNFMIDCFDLAGNLLASTRTSQPTFTVNETTSVYIRYRVNLGVTVDNEIVYAQLEKGAVATTYEPYQSQSYEINLGKNLFDPVAAEVTRGLLRSNGVIDYTVTNRLFTNGFIKVEPNTTYTFQFKSGVAGKNVQSYALAYQADKTTVTGNLPTNAWYNSGFTFTTGPNDEYIRMSYHFTDNTDISITDVVEQQLELGDTVTPYSTYFEPIELCKLGDYQDYIYKSGDDWYLHKEFRKLQLDGSSDETWVRQSGGSDDYHNWYEYRDIVLPEGISTEGLRAATKVDNFAQASINYTTTTEGYQAWISPSLRFRYDMGNLSSTSLWRAWLESNPLTVYYPVTPTDTQITDATLVEQLEALAGADTYNEKTYIKVTATEPNLPALLKVEAYSY